MSLTPSARETMLEAVPNLRAFAISLSRNVDHADDLVQETLLRAIDNIDSFQPGTNMSAWLFTILRNLFRSEYRKRRREVEDPEGAYADTLTSVPEQQGRIEFEELRVALAKLAPDQREAIIPILSPPPSNPAANNRSAHTPICRELAALSKSCSCP